MVVRTSVIVGLCAATFSFYLLHFLLTTQNQTLTRCWVGLLLTVGGLTSAVCFDIFRKQSSPFHNARSSVDHYIAITTLSWLGWYMKRKLEQVTKDIVGTQDKILMQRMKENADTEYGKLYKFSEVKSRNDFVNKHPLTRIDHYELFINRMMAGEQKILTDSRPIVFAVTSGTSGKSSILPMTKKQRINFFTQGVSVSYRCLLDAYPGSNSLQKSLKFFYTPKWRTSEAGIPVGPNSSSPTNSQSLLNIYSTPKPGFDILSEPEALYIHLLYGLRDRTLGMLEANFATTIYSSLRALDIFWKDLADDIEKGCVNPKLKIDTVIRDKLDKLLTADPVRAQEVRDAFIGGKVGVVKRLWPNCHLLLSADTGAFELQANMLRETYCKDIPLYSPLYAASEGLLGVNIWPQKHPSKYMLAPQSMFFEFIPVEKCEEDQPQTYFIDQVEKGHTYELVITNAGGLCRYRFGDVIKVVDFYNQCPVIEFLYRQGQLLNVRSEKTSETAFYKALTESSEKWAGVKIVDYCCAESILTDDAKVSADSKSFVPFYHVFIELENEDGDIVLSEEQKNSVDEALCSQSYVYDSFRKKGSIGPMKVCLVKPGTFKELKEFAIATTTTSSNQYKVPRVLRRKEALDLVMKNVIM